MISRYDVWLNDMSLSEIDPQIYVYDINYNAVAPTRTSGRIASSDGQFTADRDYVSENKITVQFEVHEYSTVKRQEIVQNVIAWAANGGWLKTTDRPGQRIYVRATTFPSVQSVMRWTDNLSIEFTARDYPFWQDENPEELVLNAGDEGEIYVPGFRKADVEAVIVPSETMTGFTVECGDTWIEMDGISVPANQEIKLYYTDDHHILSIESGNTSLLEYRTPESNDDLMLDPGMGYVYFDSATAAVCTVRVRGVYL